MTAKVKETIQKTKINVEKLRSLGGRRQGV